MRRYVLKPEVSIRHRFGCFLKMKVCALEASSVQFAHSRDKVNRMQHETSIKYLEMALIMKRLPPTLHQEVVSSS